MNSGQKRPQRRTRWTRRIWSKRRSCKHIPSFLLDLCLHFVMELPEVYVKRFTQSWMVQCSASSMACSTSPELFRCRWTDLFWYVACKQMFKPQVSSLLHVVLFYSCVCVYHGQHNSFWSYSVLRGGSHMTEKFLDHLKTLCADSWLAIYNDAKACYYLILTDFSLHAPEPCINAVPED